MKRLLVFVLALIATVAFAKSLYVGVLEGKITDPDGKPLKEVKVILLQASSEPSEQTQTSGSVCASAEKQKGSQSAKTGSNGKYNFVAVRPGIYTICYLHEGFKPVEKRMEIKQAITNTVNLQLEKVTTDTEESE